MGDCFRRLRKVNTGLAYDRQIKSGAGDPAVGLMTIATALRNRHQLRTRSQFWLGGTFTFTFGVGQLKMQLISTHMIKSAKFESGHQAPQ